MIRHIVLAIALALSVAAPAAGEAPTYRFRGGCGDTRGQRMDISLWGDRSTVNAGLRAYQRTVGTGPVGVMDSICDRPVTGEIHRLTDTGWVLVRVID